MAKIEDIRMNDFAPATDGKYIYAEDENMNQVKVSKETLSNMLVNQNPSLKNYIISGSGVILKVANYTFLGSGIGDGVESVLLLFPYDINAKSEFSGILGQLFYLRGSSSSGLISSMISVNIARAYMDNSAHFDELGMPVIKSVGICKYNGIEYIAIKHHPTSLFALTFNGLYSRDTLFTFLLLSSVTWVKDL